MPAAELIGNPLSLHIVCGMLSNKELAAWLGTQDLKACHCNLRDVLDSLCGDDVLEPLWLAATCVVKMWGLHDLERDLHFREQFDEVTTCLSMVYEVCTSPQAHTCHYEVTSACVCLKYICHDLVTKHTTAAKII